MGRFELDEVGGVPVGRVHAIYVDATAASRPG